MIESLKSTVLEFVDRLILGTQIFIAETFLKRIAIILTFSFVFLINSFTIDQRLFFTHLIFLISGYTQILRTKVLAYKLWKSNWILCYFPHVLYHPEIHQKLLLSDLKNLPTKVFVSFGFVRVQKQQSFQEIFRVHGIISIV